MCGINVIVSYRSNTGIDIRKMNKSIAHRGPDSSGVYEYDKNGLHIAMGMQRLSIIDIEGGYQPLISDCGSYVLVFNGELYNYRELKRSLKYPFKSSSDTEVLLAGLIQSGDKFVPLMDGMFGFAFLDKKKNKLIIGRDHYGEKSLYYHHSDNEFILSSEIKGVMSAYEEKLTVDREAVTDYFSYSFIPEPATIYREIRKIKRSSCATIDLANFELITRLYDPGRAYSEATKIDLENSNEVIFNEVMSSVESRLVSDVRVGSFLSGGVDSGIVSFAANELVEGGIDTFSIVSDNPNFDESYNIKRFARHFNIKTNLIRIEDSDLTDYIFECLRNYDQPFGDSSAIVSHLLCDKVADYGKVFLSGDGGDELFLGYNRHKVLALNKKIASLKMPDGIIDLLTPKKDNRGSFRHKATKLLKAINSTNDTYASIVKLGFSDKELEYLGIKANYQNSLGSFEYRDHDKRSLEADLLVKMDIASMSSSIEVRSPLLNFRLEQVARSFPVNKHIDLWGGQKLLLKKAFQAKMPKNYFSMPKQGFGIPVGDLLRTTLYDSFKYLFDCEEKGLAEFVNLEYVNQLMEEHRLNSRDHTSKLWTIFSFMVWYNANKKRLK